MKVLLISNPPDPSSGTGQYTAQLAASLDGQVEVERVSLPVDARSPLPFVRAATARRLFDADLVHVQHDYVVFGPRGVYTWLFFPLLFITSTLASVPVIVTAHEVLNAELVAAPFRRLKRFYVSGMNKVVAGTADHLVFLSEQAEERFQASVAADDTSQIPHGVQDVPVEVSTDAARREFGFDPDDVVVATPGYVSPRKGSDVVVDLAERCPEWEFLLAGGPPRPKHEPFFERLQERAPENVTITGRLSEERFHAAFVAADAAVLPYSEVAQTGVVNAVNQSGVFNWCAAHRIPVAATDCPRFRAVNERWACPRLFDVSDLADVESVVRELLSTDERDRQRSNLDEYTTANSMSTVAAWHVELYEDLLP
jgi:glycosyltransferase involved in cell wall biosynthesis